MDSHADRDNKPRARTQKKKKKGKKEEGSRIQVKINAKKHALPIRI